VGYILSLLPLLACPVGMVLMMKFMPGMNHGGHAAHRPSPANVPGADGMTGYDRYPKTLEDEATTLANRRAAIVGELESMGEVAAPAARPSCCGGGRAPRKATAAEDKR
jgi:hypothetical protein